MTSQAKTPATVDLLAEYAPGVMNVLTHSQLVGVGILDKSHHIEYVNDEICRMSGLSHTDLIGKSFFTLICSNEAQCIGGIISEREQLREDFYPVSLLGAGGHEINALMAVLPISPTDQHPSGRFLGLLFDLGRLFNDEDTLVKNASLYYRPFDILSSPVFVKDLQGVYRLCNLAFCRGILGLDREAVIGRTMLELAGKIPPDLIKAYLQMDQMVLAKGNTQTETSEVQQADGTRCEYEVHKTVLQDEHNQPTGVIGIMHDVSDRLAAERLLGQSLAEADELNVVVRQQRDMLVQSEKLAAMGQLAAGVAHEINNPLSYVKSNIQALSNYIASMGAVCERMQTYVVMGDDATEDDRNELLTLLKEEDITFVIEDAANIVHECLDGIDRIRTIILGMKGFSRRDDDSPMAAEINELVKAALLMAHNEIKHHCEVVTEFADLADITCYPQQIEQVILNLVINAASAIEDQGIIRVTTAPDGDGVSISVSDNGTGIPKDRLKTIFEPFYTTKEAGKGTGLGLHIAGSIVERHGGRIDVESTVDEGTTFRVVLPSKPPAPEA